MTDVSTQATMKGAAKCSKHCDLQNSVNQGHFERVSCFWDIPGSMPASVLCSTILRHGRFVSLLVSNGVPQCALTRLLMCLLYCMCPLHDLLDVHMKSLVVQMKA